MFHISPGLLITIWNKAKAFFPLMRNLLLRPKLSLNIKQKKIIFLTNDNKEHHHSCFCLLIKNNSKKVLRINPNKIFINNERCPVMHYNTFNPPYKSCKNDICQMYTDRWREIVENDYTFEIKPYETKIFPSKPIKGASHLFIATKKQSLLFKAKTKLSVTIEINGNAYEYGINRISFYEKYINYLAFHMDAP